MYEAIGAYRAGKISLDELYEAENGACPGAGACGGQFTANTMATVLEFLGLSPGRPQRHPRRGPAQGRGRARGGRARHAPRPPGHPPEPIVTRESFDNAIASVAATGGSTNAVLHLPAIAHEFGIPLSIDEFGEIADRTPLIADMRPGGRYSAADMYDAGGVGLVMRELLKADKLHGERRPSTGGRSRRSPRDTVETDGQEVVQPIETPIKPIGGLTILHGSLAPEGSSSSWPATSGGSTAGRPACSTSEQACFEAVKNRADRRGRRRRHPLRGPIGGPGMQEMLSVTGALVGEGLGESVALLTDGRFSRRDPRPDGRPRRPEAALGGPIALVEEGDSIVVDVDARRAQPGGDGGQLAERRARWTPPAPR